MVERPGELGIGVRDPAQLLRFLRGAGAGRIDPEPQRVPDRLNALSTGGRLRGLTGAGSGAAWPTPVPPPAVGILAPPLVAAPAERAASTTARTRAAARATRRMPSDTVDVLLPAFKPAREDLRGA